MCPRPASSRICTSLYRPVWAGRRGKISWIAGATRRSSWGTLRPLGQPRGLPCRCPARRARRSALSTGGQTADHERGVAVTTTEAERAYFDNLRLSHVEYEQRHVYLYSRPRCLGVVLGNACNIDCIHC